MNILFHRIFLSGTSSEFLSYNIKVNLKKLHHWSFLSVILYIKEGRFNSASLLKYAMCVTTASTIDCRHHRFHVSYITQEINKSYKRR
ncbi:hypothetical protein HanPSC8_Chr02g0063621 [Helianthus annuus]|nr:hypothetical protein HanPSC8_Chr02g0063621 [Helianthus annuus]